MNEIHIIILTTIVSIYVTVGILVLIKGITITAQNQLPHMKQLNSTEKVLTIILVTVAWPIIMPIVIKNRKITK